MLLASDSRASFDVNHIDIKSLYRKVFTSWLLLHCKCNPKVDDTEFSLIVLSELRRKGQVTVLSCFVAKEL